MKILLRFFGDLNFGDDVMVKMLLSKFPEIDFYTYKTETKYLISFTSFSNFHIIKGKYTSISFLKNCREYSAYILVGGSVFTYNNIMLMPGQLKEILLTSFLRSINVDSAVFGANISKLPNKWYKFLFLDLLKMRLKILKVVTFRDDYSYKLALTLNPVGNIKKYADIVFGYEIINVYKTEDENNLGISAFCTKNKDEDFLLFDRTAKICDAYCDIKSGYIKLFCFSSGHTNDAYAANEIFKLCRCKDRIKIISYNGDDRSFVNEIRSCSVFIPIRFHSIVMCMLLDIPFLPVCYSNKSENLLIDTEFKGKALSIPEFYDIDQDKVTKILLSLQDAKIPFFNRELINSSYGHYNDIDIILKKK